MNCYTIGAVIYVLTGLIHGMTHFAPPPENPKPQTVAAQKAMAEAIDEMMGLSHSLTDILHCLSWYMTVLTLVAGTLAFTVRRACRTDAGLLRKASIVMALGAAVLAAMGAKYGIGPPLVLFSLATLSFAAAALRAQPAAAGSA
ncbi:MAG TPA: hypothetical protein VF384_17505 [Planctomycetota bacterium]